MVELRIGARQDSGMRWRRERNVGKRLRENYSVLRQEVEIRGQSSFRTEKVHSVGASRVQRDDDDVGQRRFGSLGWAAGNLWALAGA